MDEVFSEVPLRTNECDISFIKNNASFNCTASTSMESVSDHFEQLFYQVEEFTKTANEMDSLFVRRRMNQMKDGMRVINSMFDDLLIAGNRLEKFLMDRQNNNICGK